METLHPELEQLRDKFNSLIDDYENGHIDYSTAEATLKSMIVIDGSGTQWSMDENGSFLRAAPGEASRVANPSSFMPAQLPQRPSNNSAPWAPRQEDLMSPPVGSFNPQTPFPQGTSPFAGGMPTQPGPAFERDVPDFSAGPPEVKGKKVRSPRDSQKAPKAASIKTAQKNSESPITKIINLVGDFDPKSLLEGRGKTLLIAFVCLLVLFVGYKNLTGGADSSGIPSGNASTTTENTTAGNEAPESLPVDGNNAPPAAATTPNGDEQLALLTAVTSGDRAVAAPAVKEPGDAALVALSTATLKGYQATGLDIKFGPVAQENDGAVQDWSLVDATSQKVYATSKVTYLKDESGAWKLKSWPTFK